MWFEFRPYVPVAARRAQAAREVQKRRKNGQTVTPVVIEGRKIAHTFWGNAWCDNLESYSDFANRLPRGRTYVRNGSVVDLQIHPGKLTALVSGSELYDVAITIDELPKKEWQSIKTRCAGQIGSVVELLQGKLDKSVITIITDHNGGLFPRPGQIHMSCSCPDWAGMCKHIAAVLYGVGARLDHHPDLLFLLRKVDHLELIEEAVSGAGKQATTKKKTLAASDIAGVFGIEFGETISEEIPPCTPEQLKKRGPSRPRKVTPPVSVSPPTTTSRRTPKARKSN
jgi:uncharacterized Zn finger protein